MHECCTIKCIIYASVIQCIGNAFSYLITYYYVEVYFCNAFIYRFIKELPGDRTEVTVLFVLGRWPLVQNR